MSTLKLAIRNLAFRPHLILRMVVMTISALMLLIAVAFAESQVESERLFLLIELALTALLVLIFLCHYGEVIKRIKLRLFFIGLKYDDYCKRFPKYKGTTNVNQYIDKVRFYSRVHVDVWEKKRCDLEMVFRKKISKIESLSGNNRLVDIHVVKKDLPKLITWCDSHMHPDIRVFAVGESFGGQSVWDLGADPHGLVAGATSAGKTNIVKVILNQAIQKDFNVTVLDFKRGGDFAIFGDITISEPEEAREALLFLLAEIRRRMQLFKESGASNIDEYNELVSEKLIRHLLVIDEAAEIFDVRPKDKDEKELYIEIDKTLRTLARMSRAAGVHILMGLIRPDHNILDGQVKNNLTWRTCGYFADPAASRIVIDSDKATELPADIKGRFIIQDGKTEVQCYYLQTPTNDEQLTDNSAT